ncbi:hypothetical protein I3760_Q019000 [Carya illinoinensis]|nr:hypothetical protein I3760_Q019000 [Carya illinoinensis]
MHCKKDDCCRMNYSSKVSKLITLLNFCIP